MSTTFQEAMAAYLDLPSDSPGHVSINQYKYFVNQSTSPNATSHVVKLDESVVLPCTKSKEDTQKKECGFIERNSQGIFYWTDADKRLWVYQNDTQEADCSHRRWENTNPGGPDPGSPC